MPGPDIFLSYNREDSDRAKQFAEGFAAQGLDVWWDVALRSGEAYDEVTENALRNAKAVVVLWSQRSVVSRWVRAEATLAERKKTLMPAMIEECERPIMFELTQTADLTRWNGDTSDAAWKDFARHVREFVGKEAQAPAVKAKEEPLPGLDQISVVVLPFANMSRDEDQEYFADGITEDVITDLSKVSALGVIARNTAFTFKGKHVDVADVARQLNVTHVLEGSVRKAGNRVRVTAQLIDGSNNNHVWADRWDRDLDDIFALQDELSKAIVDALKVRLLPQEEQQFGDRGTRNQEAYDLYMRARSNWLSGNNSGHASVNLLPLLHQSTTLDPGFSDAWLLMAAIYREESFISPAAAEESLRLSDEAYQSAIACEADPHKGAIIKASYLGAIKRDWIGAGEAMERAAELAPKGKPFVHLERSIFYAHTGRLADAIDEVRAYIRLDPITSPPYFTVLYDGLGRFEESLAETERQRRLLTYPPIVELFALVRSMVLDDPTTVRSMLKAYLPYSANFLPHAAEIEEHFDDKARVEQILKADAADPEFSTATHTTGIALFAAYFGLTELAAACLKTAFVDLKATTYTYLWHPIFRQVRQTAPYKEIIRAQGIYDYWRQSGHWGDLARPLGDDDFEIIA